LGDLHDWFLIPECVDSTADAGKNHEESKEDSEAFAHLAAPTLPFVNAQ